jgi:hypothetical protein
MTDKHRPLMVECIIQHRGERVGEHGRGLGE